MASLRTDDAAAESYSPSGRAHPSNPDQVGQQMPGSTRRAAREVAFPEKRSKVLSAGGTDSRDKSRGRVEPERAGRPDRFANIRRPQPHCLWPDATLGPEVARPLRFPVK